MKKYSRFLAGVLAVLISAGSTGFYAVANKDETSANGSSSKTSDKDSSEDDNDYKSPEIKKRDKKKSEDTKKSDGTTTRKEETVYVLTDANGQTNVPNIYAIGDATGGIMLAHAATAMGRNALAHMNNVPAPVRADIIPACIYTDPEIASVGLTTEQAGSLGIDADSRKVVMSANGKTVLSAQERGFIKVVFEVETHKILGAQMMCARASDMISEFAEAIVHGLTTEQMFSVVRPHPTFCEAITDACR